MNDADLIREEYEAALADATWYERRRIESRGRFVPALDRLVNERDEALARLSSIGGYEGYSNAWDELERRAEAAEAEVARLTDILYMAGTERMLARAVAAEAALRDAQTERDKFRQRAEGIWNFLGPEGQDALIESGWHP
jgi:hypothetical protein